MTGTVDSDSGNDAMQCKSMCALQWSHRAVHIITRAWKASRDNGAGVDRFNN